MIQLKRSSFILLILIFASLVLVGCGGSTDDSASSSSAAQQTNPQSSMQAESEPEPTSPPEPEPEMVAEPTESMAAEAPMAEPESASNDAVVVNDEGVAEVTIGGTDQMQYTVRAFTVDAGQEVELTLVHEGNLPVGVMGHNVVILPTGEDYIAFSQEVTSEGGSVENEYLPESLRDGLVAYTSLIGGGETDTIRFTAPDTPGDYPFVCTFPGHFGVMNGVMTVL